MWVGGLLNGVLILVQIFLGVLVNGVLITVLIFLAAH